MAREHDWLEELLRGWGDAQTGRHERRNDDAGPGSHPISRAREFAPMTRTRAAVRLAGRDGEGRRRMMARELGAAGIRIVPMDYVDPVPCNASCRGGGGSAAVDQGIPDHLKRVDQAVMKLHRADPLRGLVIRQQYTGAGHQEDKAARVQEAWRNRHRDQSLTVSLRAYRDHLRAAREQLRMELGGVEAAA